MNVLTTTLPGVLLLEPVVHRDARGFFLESARDHVLKAAGIHEALVQDCHSRSQAGVLRGLHFQWPGAQGKLVRTLRGRVFDVVVDIRRDSPYFGRWLGVELDDVLHRQLWIPSGFAHGFCVLSEVADVAYRCSRYYEPAAERGIAWNDPELAIAWPGQDWILSARDRALPPLATLSADELPLMPSAR
ncbi:MAG: dTDP-4-dehydrorhamnose 3,5-epimerase [Moraxellaceae bacterium]